MQPVNTRPVGDAGAAGKEVFVPRGGPQALRRRGGPGAADSGTPSSARSAAGRLSTFREDVGHAAAETYLVTGLAFTLLRYLGWLLLFLFKAVTEHILYRLDLYMPRDRSKSSPVVAFVTGGAWIIGYKAWGALLGRRLAERGIIVACIDYRNFPQGTISDMVADASEGISFICNNAASYGGDPNQIYLMGQSAGAHIAACALVEQAQKESSGEQISWNVAQIKAYFGLSGGYNIQNLVNHFHERGLYRSIFLSIMEGEESLPRFSPEIVTKKLSAEAVALLPQIILLHGTEDDSIPSSASETFADVLKQASGKVKLQLYEGKTHTDVFIQDPLRGGKDQLVDDVVSVIHADDAIAWEKDASTPIPERLVYEWQIKLARQISPF
ncbi:hypothetical protein PR202_ga06052 [Eleusine coracana subsp. coracana]|uniref:protein-S-isoprenylcysteine alpha-carbonyl methylesterase n=1 Tax=Eleusine coracana subsp. coracana TaxID=191504 RepID=A0AAV5BVR8_ELECO|nr:hypothetical protein PR202_ga06052 [Eleusine coracana subsp. coracana]